MLCHTSEGKVRYFVIEGMFPGRLLRMLCKLLSSITDLLDFRSSSLDNAPDVEGENRQRL